MPPPPPCHCQNRCQVFGRRAEKARNHDSPLALQQGHQRSLGFSVGRGQIWGRFTVRAIGDDDLFRVDISGLAKRREHPCHQPSRETLALGNDQIAGARGQLAQDAQAADHRLQGRNRLSDIGIGRLAGPSVGNGTLNDVEQAHLKGGQGFVTSLLVPLLGQVGDPEKDVCHPSRGRAHHHDGALPGVNDASCIQIRRRVRQGRTAEFIDDRAWSLAPAPLIASPAFLPVVFAAVLAVVRSVFFAVAPWPAEVSVGAEAAGLRFFTAFEAAFDMANLAKRHPSRHGEGRNGRVAARPASRRGAIHSRHLAKSPALETWHTPVSDDKTTVPAPIGCPSLV